MTIERDKQPRLLRAFGPRALWLAVSSVFAALLVGAPSFLMPASAVATMSGPDRTAVVGVSVSETSTYTSDAVLAPASLSITPTTQGGLILETVTLDTVLLSGTPTEPGLFSFSIVGADETTTDTATLSVTVTCPEAIDVDSGTASACLASKPTVTVGTQGAIASDTATPVSAHAGDPHVSYNTQADGCASCHRTHADGSQAFRTDNTVSRALECLACHDGTGASSNVAAQYSGSGANAPESRSYYTHDALAVNTGHLAASSDDAGSSVAANEFMGVANRHSDCVDCHNPHSAAVSPMSQQWTDGGGTNRGWGISGALKTVSVVLAQADTASAFVPWAVSTGDTRNYEYQLCLKCHSGFTVLAANDPWRPSRDWLDKAAEINPATPGNNSMHPIMAPGTNQTETMTASLQGTSAQKLWRFATTDTVRCAHCHAGGATTEGPRQVLNTHTSPNRGILLAPYRDRDLMAWSATADTARFALCFTCHTDVPFVSNTSSGTAFQFHYEHFGVVKGSGIPADALTATIDTPGAGNGHALCSECHFRLHSTVNKTGKSGPQTIDGTRLVNFAPNVEPVGGRIEWTARAGSTPGTCTLKCHGVVHNGTAY